jgi:glycosyltransferase involved in cell wall biosynthesis
MVTRSIVVVTPVLPPAPGGAATYTMILARGLVRSGAVDRVILVSERHPERPAREDLEGGAIVVERRFPFRAGRARKDAWSYAAFALQQLRFLDLGALVRAHGAAAILLHASFLYQAGLVRAVLRHDRRLAGVPVVLDVRDPLAPPQLFARPGEFAAVIACAERIAADLARHPGCGDKVRLIPIPIEPITVDEATVTATLARHGLAAGGYLFNANGISRLKGIDLLIEAVTIRHAAGRRLPLVVAGRERDRDAAIERAIGQGILRSLGPVPHREVLALAKASAAVVNPSAVETPSRIAIEGLMVGARSLLPPNVPEFEPGCGAWICAGDAPGLARQIDRLLDSPGVTYGYDLAAHLPERVIPLYARLLDEIAGRRTALPAADAARAAPAAAAGRPA